MIIETKIIKEYHANGKLAYTFTMAIIAPGMEALYENRRIRQDGYTWIRIGAHQKFFDNGVMAWQLDYNNLGGPIKNDIKNRRKDGSIIEK